MLNFSVSLYSPRWGHEDEYSIEFSQEAMQIEASNGKRTKCVYVEKQDPNWAGYETIFSVLSNDSIAAPANLDKLLIYIWMEWRDGGINDEQAREEFQALVDWINIITENKPRTEFWKGYF